MWVLCELCGNKIETDALDVRTLTVYRDPFVDTCDDCFFCNERCREEYEDRYRDDVYSYCPNH